MFHKYSILFDSLSNGKEEAMLLNHKNLHIKQNADVMTNTAGYGKQMPDRVKKALSI